MCAYRVKWLSSGPQRPRGQRLPDDYIRFLRHKSGLYFDEYSGSYESELHDVESILTIRMFDFYPPQMLIIGQCSVGQTQILIHTDEADPSRGMYAIDPIGDDFFMI